MSTSSSVLPMKSERPTPQQIREERLKPFESLFSPNGPDSIEVWVGGQWMLGYVPVKDGRMVKDNDADRSIQKRLGPIPQTAMIPNPLKQRQFMNQDDLTGLPVHLISGHRSKADADRTVCPDDVLKRLIINEERRIRVDYASSKRVEVDNMIKDVRAEILATQAARNEAIADLLSTEAQADEDEQVRRAEEILARRKAKDAAKTKRKE